MYGMYTLRPPQKSRHLSHEKKNTHKKKKKLLLSIKYCLVNRDPYNDMYVSYNPYGLGNVIPQTQPTTQPPAPPQPARLGVL